MPIVVNLDVMMARRKMSLNELSDQVGLTLANLSILKTGKAKAIRFSTLGAICRALHCQPADILEYRADQDSSPNRSLLSFSPGSDLTSIIPVLFMIFSLPFLSCS